MGETIPKVIMQTNHTPPKRYMKQIIRDRAPGWKYEFYDDAAVFKYFDAHPDPEFPNMKAKFTAMPAEALAKDAQAMGIGERLFVNNCAGCHGSDAKGSDEGTQAEPAPAATLAAQANQ